MIYRVNISILHTLFVFRDLQDVKIRVCLEVGRVVEQVSDDKG